MAGLHHKGSSEGREQFVVTTGLQRLVRVDPVGAAESRGAAQRIDASGVTLCGIVEVIVEDGTDVVSMRFGFGADNAFLTG
jgi:hypothetical protein